MKTHLKNYYNFSNTQLVIERCMVSYVVHSPPSSYIASNIALCVVNIIFTIAGIILNLLVVFSFYKSAKLRSKVCYFAIMIMCSNDLALVTVIHPMFTYALISEILGTPSCLYESCYGFVFALIYGMSFWNLFLANIDRYLAIVHPIWHRVNVTKRRFLSTCVCFWMYNIVVAVGMVFSPFLLDVLIPFQSAFVTFATIFIYVSIFFVSRKSFSSEGTSQDLANREETTRNRMAFWRELKMAKSYFIVVVLIFISYSPRSVILARQPAWYETSEKHISLAEVYGEKWSMMFVLTMSTLNCVVFFWANRELRREGSKIIKKCVNPLAKD